MYARAFSFSINKAFPYTAAQQKPQNIETEFELKVFITRDAMEAREWEWVSVFSAIFFIHIFLDANL